MIHLKKPYLIEEVCTENSKGVCWCDELVYSVTYVTRNVKRTTWLKRRSLWKWKKSSGHHRTVFEALFHFRFYKLLHWLELEAERRAQGSPPKLINVSYLIDSCYLPATSIILPCSLSDMLARYMYTQATVLENVTNGSPVLTNYTHSSNLLLLTSYLYDRVGPDCELVYSIW